MHEVQNIELLKGITGGKKATEKDSMFGSLITRLVNNVQIVIEDIQVEFSDTDGKQFPYQLKFCLEEFRISTTNKNWKDHFEADIKQSVYKLLTINSFSIKMLHSDKEKYLLEPIHATGRLSLNKIFNVDVPKTNVDIFFNNVNLTLDNLQIGSILELAASFVFLKKKKKFCKNLPASSIEQEPLTWFHYAISSIREVVRKKKFLITLQSLEVRRKDRLLYMAVYAKVLRDVELNPEERSMLEEMERRLSASDIVYFRDLARKNVQTFTPTNQSVESLPKKKSFFSFLWERVSDTNITTEIEQEEKETEEFFENLVKDDADFISTSPTLAANTKFSKFKIGFYIESTSFTFVEYFNSDQMNLLEFSLEKIYFGTTVRGREKIFDFDIWQIFLKSGVENSSFPFILEPLRLDGSENIFSLNLSHNPSPPDCNPYNCKISFSPLRLVICKEPVDSLMSFFHRSEYSRICSKISGTLSTESKKSLERLSRAGLEFMFSRKKGFSLQVSLDESVIVIPDKLDAADSFVHQISFSSLVAHSKNFLSERRKFFQSFEGNLLTSEQVLELQSILYDLYFINIREFLWTFYPNHAEYSNSAHVKSSKFIDCSSSPVSITLSMLAFPPGNYSFPKNKVSIQITDGLLLFNDLKYQSIMKMLDNFLDSDEKIPIVSVSPSPISVQQITPVEVDGDEFYDIEEPSDEVLTFSEFFKTVPDLDVVDVSLLITARRVEAYIQCPLKFDGSVFEASLYQKEDFVLNLIHTTDRIQIDFAITNYELLINKFDPSREKYILRQFIQSPESFSFNLDYHSVEHPLLGTVFNNEKFIINLAMTNPQLWFDFYSLDRIIAFLKQSFPSSSNIYREPRIKEEDPYLIKVNLALQNTVATLMFPNSAEQFLTLQTSHCNLLYIDGIESELCINLKKDGNIMNANDAENVLNLTNFSFNFKFSKLLSDFDFKFSSLRLNLTPNLLYNFILWISNRSSMPKENVPTIEPEKQSNFSLIIGSLNFSLPFDHLKVMSVISENIILKTADDSLNISNDNSFITINDYKLSNKFKWKFCVTKDETTSCDWLDFSLLTDVELFFDELCFFIFINRIQQAVKAIKTGLEELDKNSSTNKLGIEDLTADQPTENPFLESNISNENKHSLDSMQTIHRQNSSSDDLSKKLKRSISVKSKTVTIFLTADCAFLGTVKTAGFNYYINSYFDDTTVSEFSTQSLRLFDANDNEIIHSTAPPEDIFPFAFILNFSPAGISLKLDLYKFTISCPLYYLMKLKQIFLGWTDATTKNLINFDCVVLPDDELQFVIQVIIRESIFKISHSQQQNLIFQIALCEIIKNTSLKISIPSIFAYFYENENDKIQILNKFGLTFLLDNPSPVLQEIQLNFDPLNVHYSHLDLNTLTSIIQKGFLATPQVVTSVSLKDVDSNLEGLVEEKAIFNFKEINVFFVDQSAPLCSFKIERSFFELKNWSYQSKFTCNSEVTVNAKLFNINTTAWEPFLENSTVKFEFKLQENRQIFKLISDKVIEFNFCTKYIHWFRSMQNYLKKERKISHLDVISSTCLIRNLSGYDIALWPTQSGNVPSSSSTIEYSVPNGEERLIHFKENEEAFLMRQDVQLQNFSLHLLGSTWETLQKVFIIKEGSYYYTLRPKLNGINHKIVVEISIENGIKVVIFRSPFRFFNATLFDFELEIENVDGNVNSVKISPNNFASIRIEDSYDCKIRLRPLIFEKNTVTDVTQEMDYVLEESAFTLNPSSADSDTNSNNLFANGQSIWAPSEFISWKQLSTPNETIILSSKLANKNANVEEGSSEHFFFSSLISQLDSGKNVLLDYPLLTVNINYPLIIHNLIPYPIECTITDRETNCSHSFSLAANSNYPLYQINIAHLLLCQLKLKTSSDIVYEHENYLVVSPGNQSKYDVDERVDLYASPTDSIQLSFDYDNSIFGGRLFFIYSSIVIFNRTEFNLYLRNHALFGYEMTIHDRIILSKNESAPMLFSYPNEDELRKRVSFSIDQKNWSQPICFDDVGSRYVLELKDSFSEVTKNLALEISIGSGIYLNTTVIEIIDRYLVHNQTVFELDVTFTLSSFEHISTISPNSSAPLHCSNPSFFIRKKGSFQWSHEVALSTGNGPIMLPFYANKHPSTLLKVEFSKEESTIKHIIIREESFWPYKITNNTDQLIILSQQNSESIHQIGPNETLDYALDDPYGPHVAFISFANCMKEFTLDEYGTLVPFSARIQSELCWFSIDIKTSGSVFVVTLFPTTQYGRSLEDKENAASSSSESENSLTNVKMFIVSFAEIGFALYNNDLEEFLYSRLSDINLSVVMESFSIDSFLTIRWVQIDNQLFQSKYPICLCPKNLTKADSFSNPCISASCKQIIGDEDETFRFFENIFLKFKDIYFNIDENTFYEIVMFWRSFSIKETTDLRRSSLIPVHTGVFELSNTVVKSSFSNINDQNYLIKNDRFEVDFYVESTLAHINYYIASIEISQCGVYFSFPTASDVDENKFLKSIGYYSPIYKILASTQSAKYVISPFVQENFLTQLDKLAEQLKHHYLRIDKFPFAMKLDIFAVLDIFKKTYSGMKGFSYNVMNESDFKTGLMRGTSVLVRKTASGFSSAAFKYTNLLNSIISSTSSGMVSQKFQEKRNFLRTSASSKGGAASTFAIGAKSFFKSLTSGITGVIDEPIEGVREGGASGLLKGIFTGTTGLIFKPCIGAIDMLTYSLKACNELMEDERPHYKTRFPKVKPYDGVLREYSIKEAYGQFLLRIIAEGQFINATYVCHIDIISEGNVCVLHQEGLVMIHLSTLRIIWQVDLAIVAYSTMSKDSVLIGVQGKDKLMNRIVICPEDATRYWFHEMLNETLATKNQRKKVTEVKLGIETGLV